ncbi:expressed protein [Dictyostelium purpureum]|uniref:Expressed protein n=1 Tax=Dictyostelium purpureum TaxID=5786 RepID=F0Z715_DICPU|nr:uncharacterized protein DICPUDRAFT_96294 [Dictyostelium purpureum]EGC40253.1 expressed protein [Dictyostelium purpureum]|eukprot:XP_003283189.1 expressed protein [Dictyostelium purpureum]
MNNKKYKTVYHSEKINSSKNINNSQNRNQENKNILLQLKNNEIQIDKSPFKELSLKDLKLNEIFIKSLEIGDMDTIKLIFSILHTEDNESVDESGKDQYLEIFEYKIKKIELKEIPNSCLFSTELVELVKIIFSHTRETDLPFHTIDNPDLAEYFLTSNVYPLNSLVFTRSCIRKDFSNYYLFDNNKNVKLCFSSSIKK